MSNPSPSIFAFQEYKAFLKARLDAGKIWGEITRVAEAAGCQRSYFSRVLTDKVHLTPDHAYGIARYWNLDNAETDFFLTLLEHARSASRSYREHLEFKLRNQKRAQENIAKRLQRDRVEPGEKELTYYSAWYWSAIHIGITVPELQTPSALSQHFMLPEDTVRFVLTRLEQFGLAKQEYGKWKCSTGNVHIPKESLLAGVHHNNWRQRAMLHVQQPEHNGLHFTLVQSLSRSAFEQIKQKVLNLIDDTAAIAAPAKEEEIVCLNCDFFKT